MMSEMLSEMLSEMMSEMLSEMMSDVVISFKNSPNSQIRPKTNDFAQNLIPGL